MRGRGLVVGAWPAPWREGPSPHKGGVVCGGGVASAMAGRAVPSRGARREGGVARAGRDHTGGSAGGDTGGWFRGRRLGPGPVALCRDLSRPVALCGAGPAAPCPPMEAAPRLLPGVALPGSLPPPPPPAAATTGEPPPSGPPSGPPAGPPQHDTGDVLQQIMAITDQSLDEAQARYGEGTPAMGSGDTGTAVTQRGDTAGTPGGH